MRLLIFACKMANTIKASRFIAFEFLAHLSRRLIGELIVYEGICRPSVNIFKRYLL